MATIKTSSRYNSSLSSSIKSDPSSSSESLFRNTRSNSSSRALTKARSGGAATATGNNFTSMVKKFIETKSAPHSFRAKKSEPLKLTVAADFLAEDLKRTGGAGAGLPKKATPLGALHKKLFKGGKKEEEKKSERKALTEVKGNTRTLAMVLRSERELLNMNKDQEAQISELKSMLDEKNREVEKLKDLCLNQREEIKSLKSAILFPDVMNSQLQGILEQQGSELKQAKQLIPSLQRQVSSLTGQLQCIADDLAEVKADKYSVRSCYDNESSPRTPTYEQDEATNSLEFSSGDQTAPGSPDDLFAKDLNPCLTPYYTTRSKGFEERDLSDDEGSFRSISRNGHDFGFNSCSKKLSRSSDRYRSSGTSNGSAPAARVSDESRYNNNGRQINHRPF